MTRRSVCCAAERPLRHGRRSTATRFARTFGARLAPLSILFSINVPSLPGARVCTGAPLRMPKTDCACARVSKEHRNAKSLHATHSVSGIGAVSASCRCPRRAQLRRRPPNYHRQRVARASSSARSLLADLLVMQWRLRNEIANSVENITAIEQSLLERKSSPPGTPTCIARRGFRVYH